ncbi:MAG: S8 family serine peptidase [Pseudopedobacter sp.]|nr:S8 family serine peptidase [Deinococcales bacterium]
MKNLTKISIVLLGMTAVLGACSSLIPVSAPTVRPEFILNVPIEDVTTLEQLTQTYGAQTLERNTETGQVLVGMTEAQASAYNAVLRPSSAGRNGRAESNRGTFRGGAITASMGGSRSAWVGGEICAWSGGSRSAWVGGQYAPVLQNTTAFQQIRLESAHRIAPKLGLGIKVAIIDTGIDTSHPAFAGMLAPSSEWRDFVDGDTWPQEQGVLGTGGFGHGTAVAGLVAQVAPNATLLPIRVLGVDGSGDTLNVAQAIDWAVAKGSRVINLSLGSTERSKVVQDAIKRAKDKKVFVVSSAGNENLEALTFPAADADGSEGNHALSVGSVDAQALKSSFSNFDEDLEIVAPGEGLFTAGPGRLLLSWSGTSMAAPLVTGSLALALGQPLSIDSKDVTATLAESAFDVYNNGMNSAYKDMLGKKGRLDIEQFLKNTIIF